jgi:putative phage-type endonuclease
VIEQRSAEWFAARCGKLTASEFASILDVRKDGKPTAKREAYFNQIVAELLSGEPDVGFTAKATEWGQQWEATARAEYEIATGRLVTNAEFAIHPSVPYVGASPDGLIGSDGVLEIKCPYSKAVHIATVRAGHMPDEHTAQVQGQMWVTGREWADFVSFDPRFKHPQQRLFIQRVKRDQAYIEKLHTACFAFWSEVQAEVNRLGGAEGIGSLPASAL